MTFPLWHLVADLAITLGAAIRATADFDRARAPQVPLWALAPDSGSTN